MIIMIQLNISVCLYYVNNNDNYHNDNYIGVNLVIMMIDINYDNNDLVESFIMKLNNFTCYKKVNYVNDY